MRFSPVLVLLLWLPVVAFSQTERDTVSPSVPTYSRPDTLISQTYTVQQLKKNRKEKPFPRTFIGIGFDLLNRENIYQGDTPNGEEELPHLIQLPRWSFFLQRQLSRARYGWQGELQLRYFLREEEGASDLQHFVPGFGLVHLNNILHEEISIHNLYLYPGINHYFKSTSNISAFLGGGAAIALPLSFERVVTFTGLNSPEFPTVQTVNSVQNPSLGYYAQAGVRTIFSEGISFNIVFRYESLVQNWVQPGNDAIIGSSRLSVNDVLTDKTQFMLQCQLAYCW